MDGSPENTVLHPLHQVQFATHAKLKVDDYYHNGARRRLRLHEKGGKEHDMPVHHLLEQILDEYIVVAGLQSGQPLFQSVNSAGTAVTGRALNRYNAWAAIRKRAKAAGFLTPVGCHTWRATGITIYLENDGRLEHAQQMAGHESPRTTLRPDEGRNYTKRGGANPALTFNPKLQRMQEVLAPSTFHVKRQHDIEPPLRPTLEQEQDRGISI